MDFTEDPFKDYRYEDPFNIEDPFSDVTDSKRSDPFTSVRPTSAAAFGTDDFFSTTNLNGSFAPPEKRSGRVSAPPVAYDPFSANSNHKSTPDSAANNNDSWAAWPTDNWADDAWNKPANQTADAWPKANNQTKSNVKSASQNLATDAWSTSSKSSSDWKTDNWASKTDNWAADWGGDQNKNLNETWPSNTLPNKKEKSPKPVKYARSLVHTIGGIGRTKQNKEKKSRLQSSEARSTELLPTEEQQWAWAAAESKRLQDEADKRRKQEDAELQLALAISRQEK